MSRYEFTTREGYLVCTVEAPTAAQARERAEGQSGRTGLVCSHLSDDHSRDGAPDAMFFLGPDATV